MARRSRRTPRQRRVRAAWRVKIADYLRDERTRRFLRLGGWTAIAAAVAIGMVVAATRAEAYVRRELARSVEHPTLSFVNLPGRIDQLARNDLLRAGAEVLERDWTDDQLCRDLATRFAGVGWVAEVRSVRRNGDARFELDARYRIPVAMVHSDDGFSLIDREGVRLPGAYRFDPTWMIIQGAAELTPVSGSPWVGDDVRAALEIIAVLVAEPFASQITAVLVENFGGRVHRGRTSIELATDRAGGRIRWGSAPGLELAENSVDQKLAILRENHRRTGRADAGNSVIDISIFPDRFTIPG